MPNQHLATHLFLQLAIVLLVVKAVGRAANAVGQPQAVGEMIAGIMLGPSLFGLFFPTPREALFPPATIPTVYVLSQIGAALYMFMVGLEFDTGVIRTRMRAVLAVSIVGIIVPFVFGGGLGFFYSNNRELFPSHVASWEAAMFAGAALSITAFPMLARIIFERGISGTPLGTLTLSAGAINDALAWCILAIVLGTSSGSPSIAMVAIGGTILYVAALYAIVRPILARIARFQSHLGTGISWMLILLCAVCWITDTIGIHAVFGSFTLGLITPRGKLSVELQRILEPFTTYFLVPLFFVYSGLHTQLFLVVKPEMILVTLMFFLAACLGKGVACGVTAQLAGESKRDSLAIGALMNARGMMELILLNIALERGLITPTTFTSLVIVAIATTMLASPLYQLSRRGMNEEPPARSDGPLPPFKIVARS